MNNNLDENSIDTNEKSNKYTFKPFIKASDRAKEYKDSAYSLLLVGGLGIIFLILCLTNTIHINIAENIRVIFFVTMLVMFLIFIFVGVKNLVEAKTINALASDEENLSSDIRAYFTDNYDKESIDKLVFNEEDIDLRNELKFFKREEFIRNVILEKFGQLDQAFLDNEVEIVYNNIYED